MQFIKKDGSLKNYSTNTLLKLLINKTSSFCWYGKSVKFKSLLSIGFISVGENTTAKLDASILFSSEYSTTLENKNQH